MLKKIIGYFKMKYEQFILRELDRIYGFKSYEKLEQRINDLENELHVKDSIMNYMQEEIYNLRSREVYYSELHKEI